MTKAYGLIDAARYIIGRRFPDFAQYVLSLKPLARPDVARFGIDSRFNLFYNEEAVAEMKLEHVASAVVHQIMHLACKHHSIGSKVMQFPQLYALAACISVNSFIDDIGLELAPWEPTPERFDLPRRLLPEQYYVILRDRVLETDDGSGEYRMDLQTLFGEDFDADTFEAELSTGEASLFTDLLLENAAMDLGPQLKGEAGLVGGDQQLFAKPDPSNMHFESLLRAAIRGATRFTGGSGRSTYRVPNRREGDSDGVLLPGVVRPMLHVGLVLDTSGSMNMNRALSKALGAIDRVLKNRRRKVQTTVFECDARLQAVQGIRRISELRLKGGGGTDFSRGLPEIASHRPRPHMVIVLTDMETGWPSKPPLPIPWIIGHIGPLPKNYAPPKWGKVLRIA